MFLRKIPFSSKYKYLKEVFTYVTMATLPYLHTPTDRHRGILPVF